MLFPKKTKYRKAHKGRNHGNAKGGFSLNFGAFYESSSRQKNLGRSVKTK